jgi:hypothetical protein
MEQINEITVNGFSIRYAPLSSFVDVSKFIDGDKFYMVEVKNGHEVHSHICIQKNLDQILENPQSIKGRLNTIETENYIWLVKDEMLTNFTKYGWHLAKYLREIEGFPQVNPMDGISKNNFENFTKLGYQFVQHIENEHNQQTFMNDKGEYFMSPFMLDYNEAQLQDKTYLIDDFVEHLSHRNDVAFLANMDRWTTKPVKILHCPLKGDEEDIGGIISDYEHHLEDGEERGEETEKFDLVYYPKKEDIEKILKWSRRVEPYTTEGKKWETYNVKRYIVQDILGGKQFFKHPPQDEVEPPKRKFKH